MHGDESRSRRHRHVTTNSPPRSLSLPLFPFRRYFFSVFSTEGKETNAYNPWPYYTFTGKLRPFEQTPRRPVPPHIPRPDYADHKEGRSKSEEALRGNNTIKVLDDEEIEGMRVACRLGREVLDEAARVCDVGVTTDEIDRAVHEACIEHLFDFIHLLHFICLTSKRESI